MRLFARFRRPAWVHAPAASRLLQPLVERHTLQALAAAG